MRLFISLVLTIFLYSLTIFFLLYALSYRMSPIQKIEIENRAFIHNVIKPKIEHKEEKKITKPKQIVKKKIIKKSDTKKNVAQKSDISQSGDEDITFDDIFANVEENRNDIKKIKFAKKDDIKNAKVKKLKSFSKSIESSLKSVKNVELKNLNQILVSKDSNITDKELEKFYRKVNEIWNSLDLSVENVAIVLFSHNSFKILYSNLSNSDKILFISHLNELDLSKIDGTIKIRFNVKEKIR